MYYEVNIAKNGRHFFATASRSITNDKDLKAVIECFKEKFPPSEDYSITVTKDPQVMYGISVESILNK